MSDSPPEPLPPFRLGDPVTLDELERMHVEALLRSETSLRTAALILGIDSSTLYRKRRRWAKQERTKNPFYA